MITSIVFWAALYIVIWWITLFAVLPWGVQSQESRGKVTRGTERGAPVRPLMGKKLLATTLIAMVILAFGYALYISGFIDKYVLPPEYTAARQR